MSGKGVDKQFVVKADDTELIADGIDMTRVVFQVTDEFGNDRPFAVGAIQFTIENGEIIGDNPFALVGGCGAVWIKIDRKSRNDPPDRQASAARDESRRDQRKQRRRCDLRLSRYALSSVNSDRLSVDSSLILERPTSAAENLTSI